MKGLLALSFVIINVASDVSVTQDVVDLCSNSSDYESYTKNVTQNCGCKNISACVRKCCQKGFYLQHYEDPDANIFESICVKNFSDSFTVPLHKRYEHVNNLTLDDNFIIGMLNCGNDKWQYFQLDLNNKEEKFYVQENGTLYYPYSKYKFYNNDRYCIDEQGGLTAFVCYTPENPSRPLARMINSLGLLVSMPFLLLTFTVFVVVPNASVHRRAMMLFALSLFLAYGFLVTVQLYTRTFVPFACQTIGYSIILFFMASFLWMNVMCFDTWFAFGGLDKFSRDPKSEKKRFIYYCIYAWGIPIVHVLTVFLLNKFGDPNSRYYPGVGRNRCFLEEKLPTFIYFYGPQTVIIGLNIILFLLTSIKINKIKKDTDSFRRWSIKRQSYEYDKKKFHLYLQLLLATGITWTLEIVSWTVQLRQEEMHNTSDISLIWYISDFCNAIYGFIIFLIFVYRKPVWVSFKKKLYGPLHSKISCCKSYEVEELQKSQQHNISRSTSTSVAY